MIELKGLYAAYDGAEVPFVPAVYPNTIVCYSYSKSLSLPGERIGYICVPDWVEDSATVKRFYKENGHYRLQPENDDYEPIIVDEVILLGKVISLIRNY